MEISNRQAENFIRILLVFLITAFFGLNSNILGREKSIPVLRIKSQQKVTDKYHIRFDENNALQANVEAQIFVTGGQLFMASWGANHLPNGWASFVKNLRITDGVGKDVGFESKPNGAWQLSSISDGAARLSYQVDLSFTKTKWISGNEQAGVYQDGALFVVSKAVLFRVLLRVISWLMSCCFLMSIAT